MPRWIAFDQETSTLLQSKLAPENTIATFGRGALDYALAKPSAVVAVLPSTAGDAVLAIFRPPRRKQVVPPQPTPAAAYAQQTANRVTRAGGFLGLSDEPMFEEEPVEKKKGWWRKFWDE